LEWSVVPTLTTSFLAGVWGSGRSDVWAVGSGIRHWDGSAWSNVGVGYPIDLRAVWGSATDDLWAIGGNGSILHR